MQDSQLNGLGQRLRAAREARGWSVAQAARELRAPQVVVEAMEREDWQRLGAPVFVRGRLSGYAELLGVPVDIERVAAQIAPPALQPKATPAGWADRLDRSMPRLAAIAGTVLLMPLLYLGLQMVRDGRPVVHSLSPDPMPATPADAPLAEPGPTPSAAITEAVAAGTAPAVADEVTADSPSAQVAAEHDGDRAEPTAPMATVSAGLGALPVTGLRIEFSGESWIDVVGPDGTSLERGLVPAGSTREYAAGAVAEVTLGNAAATRVLLDGSEVNLDAMRSANVVRFAISSGGLAPVRR